MVISRVATGLPHVTRFSDLMSPPTCDCPWGDYMTLAHAAQQIGEIAPSKSETPGNCPGHTFLLDRSNSSSNKCYCIFLIEPGNGNPSGDFLCPN